MIIYGILLKFQRFKRQVPRFGNLLVNNLALNDIESLAEFLIAGTGFAPALVGKLKGIGQCSVGKRKCRGVWYRTGNVRNAVVQDAVDIICRLFVGCSM